MSLILPKSQRGIVVMTNGDSGIFIYNIIEEVFDEGETIFNYIMGATPREVVTLSDAVLENWTWIDTDNRTYLLRRWRFDFPVPDARCNLVSRIGKCFFLKDFDVQFEFISEDSFNLISNGTIDWTAKKNRSEKE